MAGLNLDKLKNEINSRKQDRGDEIVTLAGEGKASLPKDMMLHKIIEATKTGRVNEAIIAIKTVDHNANNVAGVEKSKYNAMALSPDLNVHIASSVSNEVSKPLSQSLSNTASYRPPVEAINQLNEEKERGLYDEIERMNSHQKKMNPNYPVSNPLANNVVANNNGQYPINNTLNENAFVESVEKRVLTNLNESLGAGIKEILKETVLELYTVNKIKDVINENPELIKKIILENKTFMKQIVIEIIKELQKK
jgi:hypothetical protein